MKKIRKLFLSVFILLFSFVLFTSVEIKARNNSGELYTGLVIESQEELDAQETDMGIMVRAGGKSLPSSVDLSSKMPPVGSQGRQGSCVAWSTTYYVKSYHEKIKNGWSYGWGNYNPFYSSGKIDSSKGNHVFSPAWTYNQINGGRDRGSSISNAFRLLVQKGAVPWSVMPYNHSDYLTQPTGSMKQLASSKYRSRRYSRVITSDPDNIKREISSGNPVVGGFKVTGKWKSPSQSVKNGGVFDNYSGSVTGGHAMAIVGYDDSKTSPSGHRGAFKIINSWGNYWGNKGYFWMSYKCFTMLCKYAYVLYDSEGQQQVIPSGEGESKKLMPPSGISASRGTYSDRVFVSWNKVDGAVSYILQRSTGDSKSFGRIAVVNSNSYTDRSVQSDYRYNYRVVALSGSKRSDEDLSPVAEGYALKKNNNVPAQIADLKGAPSYNGSNIKLYWSKISGASYYRIIRYDQTRRQWKDIGRSKSSYFYDRSPVKQYPNYYYVMAVNAAGKGKWSNLYKISISQKSGKPGRVTGVKATQGAYSDRIVVSWNKQPAAQYYRLFRWNNSKRKWDFNTTVRSTAYTDRSGILKGGSQFKYTVKAYNSYGASSSWSVYTPGFTSSRGGGSSWSISVRSGMGPETPEGFEVKVSESASTVNLNWKKISSLASCNIYRKEDGDSEYKLIAKTGKGASSFSEKFPGDEGDIYFYRISSVVLKNESGKTEPLSATLEEFRPQVMTTFIPGEGLRNFRGTWKAQYLKPNGKAVAMEIEIVDNGNMYKAVIKYGSKVKNIYGTYASKSRYLETGDFSFRMLPSFDNDVAAVVIPENTFIGSRIEVNFARENQD